MEAGGCPRAERERRQRAAATSYSEGAYTGVQFARGRSVDSTVSFDQSW